MEISKYNLNNTYIYTNSSCTLQIGYPYKIKGTLIYHYKHTFIYYVINVYRSHLLRRYQLATNLQSTTSLLKAISLLHVLIM